MKRYNAQEIEQFVVDHYERAETWETESLRGWINWAMANGFLLLVGDSETGAITGMAIVRLVMNANDGTDGLYHDPEGKCYFVDLAVVTKPKLAAVQALGFAILRRYGQRDEIAYQRHGAGAIIVKDAHECRRKLFQTKMQGELN